MEKAVPKHFIDKMRTEDDLECAPFFKMIRSSNKNVLLQLHYEYKEINDFNIIEAVINRIMTYTPNIIILH